MLGRNAVQDAVRTVSETETPIKFGRTKYNATRSTPLSQCGKPGFNQAATDSLPLQFG